MYSRDYRDIIGGLLLVATGLFIAFYSSAHYDFGTVFEMGPGMFPTALGYLLAGLGVLVTIPALFRTGSTVTIEWRSLAAVLASVLVFVLTIDRFGLVVAVVLLTIVGALADNKLGVVATIVLAAALSLIAVLIFKVGLGVPVSVIKWPY